MSPSIYTSVEDEMLVARRRAQIIAVATELFGRHGYHATTIKEIARCAGVSAGLIYAYVKSKEDVLYLVLQDLLRKYTKEIAGALVTVTDPIQRFSLALSTYCKLVDINEHTTLLAYRETKSLRPDQRAAIKEMEKKSNRSISECIEECISAGYFQSTNVELATYRLVLLAHGWALKGWRLKELVTLEEYILDAIDNFLRSVLTDEGWRHVGTTKKYFPLDDFEKTIDQCVAH